MRRSPGTERSQHETVRRARPRGPRRIRPVLLALAMLLAAVPELLHAQAPEADVFVANAIVAYEEKRYQDALGDLSEALRLDPTNIDALYYTGLVNIRLERFDAAAEALERARKARPGDLSVLFQLGVLYFGLGRYDEAQPLLEEVFGSIPTLMASATTSASCAIARRTTRARCARFGPPGRPIPKSLSSRASTAAWPWACSGSRGRRPPSWTRR